MHRQLLQWFIDRFVIILLATVCKCNQYLIRETDLHKFYNLFLNHIEVYMYLNNCMLKFNEININLKN